MPHRDLLPRLSRSPRILQCGDFSPPVTIVMRYPPNNVITSAVRTSRNLTTPRRQWHMSFWRRSLQISATPSDPSPFLDLPASEPSLKGTSESPGRKFRRLLQLLLTRLVDAKFEVLGAPYSLLSASLSASQNLYTRRGTLVGVSGKAENVGRVSSKDTKHFNNIATQAVSTLSLLEPFRRAVLGIPFLYQKVYVHLQLQDTRTWLKG